MSLKQIPVFAALMMFGQEAIAQTNITGPGVVVYKTKKDYRKLVPVLLSDDGSEIISYPHPGDLRTDEGLRLPDKLHKGYWLDNKGIGKNVAFLKMTYKEYAALQEAPPVTDMYAMIVDKKPLVSMCECGKRSDYKNPVKELNRIIDRKQLKTKCKSIKL